jgi:hypothetical protein
MTKLRIGRYVGIAELVLCLLTWALAVVVAGACFNKPVRLATRLGPAPQTVERAAPHADAPPRPLAVVAQEF